jgi:hypothetical protein
MLRWKSFSQPCGPIMLEMIKTITSAIKESVEIIEKVKNHFDEKKGRRLAQTLHLVYLRLNECLVTGNQIIDTLDKFVLDSEQLIYSGRYQIAIDGYVFDDLLRKQIANLDSLSECLNDYSEIVKILDNDLYLRLEQFLEWKGVGVNFARSLLERGKIPFDGLDIDDVKQLTELGTWSMAWYHDKSAIAQRVEKNSFDVELLFNHEEENSKNAIKLNQLQRLNELLKKNDLRHHLVEAKKDMIKIREFIATHFSIVDLMIDVGSDQLKKRPPW